MSKRTIGGGRVLGSGRSLAPNAVPSTSSPKLSRVFSPTPSHLSSSSQRSPSVVAPLDLDDLQSRVSRGDGASSVPRLVEASSRLACPICDEEMVTLLQLNRHIDDAHQYLEEERQVEVKDWFQIQVEKAKRFQPLAVLNQKLKGKEVFESNSNVSSPAVQRSRSLSGESHKHVDADEIVTREHWQPRTFQDRCFDPTCDKRLTATTGAVHCRKCGKIFCEEHTMYQMKLSRSALHEPVRGVWCRVCETCYKSREGYNNHTGVQRDQYSAFNAARKPIIDRAFLEVSRLEKRLSRLTNLLARLPVDHMQSGAVKRWTPWRDDERKKIEQSIVTWEDDANVERCPFCQQNFATYTFRRHHCRTCGRVVCGDPITKCSLEVGLTVALDSSQRNTATKPQASRRHVNVDVRLCRDCRNTLFERRDFEEECVAEPPDLRAYRNLRQFESGIKFLLPRFQRLLNALQDPDHPPLPEQLSEASKVRKRLLDAFTKYDIAARRIRDLPTQSPTQAKLQKAIHLQATNFLHMHMLPLKSLPKLLKHATPHGEASSPSAQSRALATIKYGNHDAEMSPSSIASGNSSAISALETKEKELREQLAVLEEQKFFVSEMAGDANRRRKFDEAKSLTSNAEDLGQEIEKINERLSQLDFKSLYTSPQILPQTK